MAATFTTQEKREREGERRVNVLLTSFAGLGLPRTLALPVNAATSVRHVLQTIYERLPRVDQPLIITTTSNRQLLLSNNDPIATLLPTPQDTLLPLRLSARLCGGKGGFGSQLRAAGGRMNSRKARNQQDQNTNGSNRNLDGRRLRTVDAAKRLAEHLATKPDMETKEREEKKKRWQAVVDAAEKREEEIKSGKLGAGQGRLDAEYVESKELAEERTREAVMRAMREGALATERTGSESSVDATIDGESEEDGEELSSPSSEEAKVRSSGGAGKTFFGWDEVDDEEDDEVDNEEDEDEDEDGEDDADEEGEPASSTAYEGKGKRPAR